MSEAHPTIRPYRPGDEDALAALFTRVFGRDGTAAERLWKGKGRPSRVETVWVAEVGGEIVFHYAGRPFRASLDGTEVDAIHNIEAMTAPEWRRRGLLTEGAGRAFAAWREAGFAFATGLPNEQWGTRAAALGWTKLFPLEWRIRPLRPERTAARRLGLPFLARLATPGLLAHRALGGADVPASFSVREAEPDDPAIDALDAALARAFRVVPRHDVSWTSWRFRPPSDPYRVVVLEEAGVPRGIAAYRVRSDTVHLAELRALPEHLPGVLSALVQRWHGEGLEKVMTLAAPGSAADTALRLVGFLKTRTPFSFEIVPLQAGLPLALLRDPAAWWLSGADFDVL